MSRYKIPELYKEKYGEPSFGTTWRFKNSGIEIYTKIDTETKTRLVPIPGREHLNLRNIENKYNKVTEEIEHFRMLSITYVDNKQTEKVKRIEVAERQKIDSLKAIRIKREADSVNIAKEKARKDALDAI
ncbi:MAG: hypothetical protein SNG69_02220 [Rikenellaceae bacterium]